MPLFQYNFIGTFSVAIMTGAYSMLAEGTTLDFTEVWLSFFANSGLLINGCIFYILIIKSCIFNFSICCPIFHFLVSEFMASKSDVT